MIPGDGVGQEVVPEGKRVLERVGESNTSPAGFMISDWARNTIRSRPHDAAEALDLLRPSTPSFWRRRHPRYSDHVTLNGLLLPIRRTFRSVRQCPPAVLYEGVASPLANRKGGDIDMVIVARIPKANMRRSVDSCTTTSRRSCYQTSVLPGAAVERINPIRIRAGRPRDKKAAGDSITKSNAQGFGMVLWDRTFKASRRRVPTIETESLLVDAAAMNFIRRPESFDVVVGSTCSAISSATSRRSGGQYGPCSAARILTRFADFRLCSSRFMAPLRISPGRTGQSAGDDSQRRMMLDHLELPQAARDIEQAVAKALSAGKARTAIWAAPAARGESRTAVLDML